MFRTLEQLEKSDIPEYYKAQVRPHFQKDCGAPKTNKYHNKHVYLCTKCDSFLSVVDRKIRSFNCPLCGNVGKDSYRFFMSKKEAAYYLKLRVMQRAGLVTKIECQVPYIVILESGESIKYVLDFRIEKSTGDIDYVDVKGKRLPEYIMKRKLVENHFKITITEA